MTLATPSYTQFMELDFSASTFKGIEEEIPIAVLFALKKPDTTVNWYSQSRDVTFCVSATENVLKISIGYRSGTSGHDELYDTITQLIGSKPDTLWKQNSLGSGQHIFYMMWDSSVLDEIRGKVDTMSGYVH